MKIEWERIKNILLKDYMYSANNVATNIDKLNLLKTNCIKKEIEIWKNSNACSITLFYKRKEEVL